MLNVLELWLYLYTVMLFHIPSLTTGALGSPSLLHYHCTTPTSILIITHFKIDKILEQNNKIKSTDALIH